MKIATRTFTLLLCATFASAAHAQATYKRDIPAALEKQAKVTETAAAATAAALVPAGKITSVELERENGKLLYSYDIATAGKSGIDEVHVDAMTGKQLGKVVHETAKMEKKEAKQEAKEKKDAAKKP